MSEPRARTCGYFQCLLSPIRSYLYYSGQKTIEASATTGSIHSKKNVPHSGLEGDLLNIPEVDTLR